MSADHSVNKAFAILFGFIGIFMVWMGIMVLSSSPDNKMEWIIGAGALASGALLLYSARQTWRKGAARQKAEERETMRLQKRKQPQTIEIEDVEVEKEYTPEILATWTYPKRQWKDILSRLAKKTRNEEVYTFVWFPVVFGLVFFSMWWLGVIIGTGFGLFYLWFRVNYVKKNFKILPGKQLAEVVITDAYLNVNCNFIHYGDGRYFLKELDKDTDGSIGDHLHFVIGWYTSKGLPAQLDLYLPIPAGKMDEADQILLKYKQAKT